MRKEIEKRRCIRNQSSNSEPKKHNQEASHYRIKKKNWQFRSLCIDGKR